MWTEPPTCVCGGRVFTPVKPGPGPSQHLRCDTCDEQHTAAIPTCPPYWHAWTGRTCRNCGTRQR